MATFSATCGAHGTEGQIGGCNDLQGSLDARLHHKQLIVV